MTKTMIETPFSEKEARYIVSRPRYTGHGNMTTPERVADSLISIPEELAREGKIPASHVHGMTWVAKKQARRWLRGCISLEEAKALIYRGV